MRYPTQQRNVRGGRRWRRPWGLSRPRFLALEFHPVPRGEVGVGGRSHREGCRRQAPRPCAALSLHGAGRSPTINPAAKAKGHAFRSSPRGTRTNTHKKQRDPRRHLAPKVTARARRGNGAWRRGTVDRSCDASEVFACLVSCLGGGQTLRETRRRVRGGHVGTSSSG